MIIIQNKWINKIIPFPSFRACNLWGILFVRGEKPLTETIINHEKIHTAQIIEVTLAATPVLFAIGVLAVGSNLNYRLVFKASKRLLIDPSNVRIQFKDGSSWMDLPVFTINGGTSAVDLSAGSTVTLAGASQAFNTLIRGKTNPTGTGARLESTIRIIRNDTIIGSVDIRYMKAGN